VLVEFVYHTGLASITVVEELVTSQGSADGNGDGKPLQLEGSSSNNQDGRRDVDAGDVLRSHEASWLGRRHCIVFACRVVVSC
jgi:hypothetical protein